MQAGGEAGYPLTDDYNGYQQEGFGKFAMTVKDGVRASTSNAYLRPAMDRPNLTVVTNTSVQRVVLADGRATGIAVRGSGGGGEERVIGARKEVILASGAIGSPHLLQVSGIGNSETLKEAGIEVKHHLPGVGENLQDHLEVYFQHECTQPVSLYSSLGVLSKLKIGIEWILNRTGLGATNHFESVGFIRSDKGVPYPDIQ